MTKTTRKRIGRGILSLSVVTGLGPALVLASGIASSETIPMVVYKNPSAAVAPSGPSSSTNRVSRPRCDPSIT